LLRNFGILNEIALNFELELWDFESLELWDFGLLKLTSNAHAISGISANSFQSQARVYSSSEFQSFKV
jgi:hypothetical protein